MNAPVRLVGAWLPPALLFASLIPLGSVGAAGTYALTLAIAVTFLAALARAAARSGTADALSRTLAGTTTLALLGLPALVLLQLVVQQTFGFSAGPSGALLDSAGWLTALACFYLLTRASIHSRRDVYVMLTALLLIAALEASYGVLNLLAGNARLLLYNRWAYHDSATGTLVSRNHFAFLMEMLLPLSLAYAIVVARASAQGGESAAPRFSGLSPARGEGPARQILVGGTIVFMVLALLLSRSRMGMASLVGAALLVGALQRAVRAPDTTPRRAPGARMAWLAVAAAFVLAGLIGIDPLIDRFLQAPRHLEVGRLPIWEATTAMFLDRPLLGHGWGSYQSLLPQYRSGPTGLYYLHAHNEYLQVLAEAGIAGFLVAMWPVVALLKRLRHALAHPLRGAHGTLVVALGVSLTAVLLHSFVDFGLRVPGVALTFVAIAALFSRLTDDPTLLKTPR